MDFEIAWRFAFARVRWPHDTTHRREWKRIIEDPAGRDVWRRAFELEPPTARDRTLARLDIAA
jgi:hypothetical protein